MKFAANIAWTFLFIFLLSLNAQAAQGGVQVKKGPTDIVNGIALHEEDITISNEFYKVTFAIGTTPPWGVPHGSIVDSAIMVDGEWTDNRTALIDFLPHGWSAWPSSYQEVSILEQSSDRVVIEIKRDYDESIELVTTYTIESGNQLLAVSTSMTNTGSKTYEDLLAGYSLCMLSGYMFGPWGTTERGYGQVGEEWFGDYVLGYDENFAMAIHYPGFTDFAWGTGWRDLYQKQTLHPQDSVQLDAWIQFEDVGSTAQVMEANLQIKEQEYGKVSGTVKSTAGDIVQNPVVIFEKATPEGEDFLYAWAAGKNGSYEIPLPEGEYTVHAAAKGYSLSSKQDVAVNAGENVVLNFGDIETGGNVTINVVDKKTQRPIDARIEVVEGPEILVEYVGARTFFTELNSPGTTSFLLAQGDYVLSVSNGAGFTSRPETVEVSVISEGDHKLSQAIELLIDLPGSGWYASDLHHHSDILDGVTPPELMVRSQLASGLDVVFVSDHDSIANNQIIQDYAHSRSVPFISGIEVSPNWGHINVLPIPLDGQDVAIDPAGSASSIFARAREMDALVIIAHPYITYGYFHSHEQDMVPGGWDADFDLIEINGAISTRDNHKALQRTWEFWNNQEKYYLVGGSDVHDVLRYPSGNIRTIAQVDGDFALDKYLESLKKGNSYASYGPLVYPEHNFGETVQAAPGDFELNFRTLSVNGIAKVTVVTEGSKFNDEWEIEGYAFQQAYDGSDEESISVALSPEKDTWYALVIEDTEGNWAMTNPIWVNII
ncbi:CehA/McbA family metallohydrolase [Desulfonatronum parangueonense]